MEFKRWKDLSDEEKDKRLKKICSYAASALFIIIFLLILMKCEACSSTYRHNRDFSDGRGHAYGERLSGNDLFADDYDTIIQSDSEKDDAEKAAELEAARLKAAEEEEARLKAEKEAAEKAETEKAEAERLAAEKKNQKAEEEKIKKAEAKKASRKIRRDKSWN